MGLIPMCVLAITLPHIHNTTPTYVERERDKRKRRRRKGRRREEKAWRVQNKAKRSDWEIPISLKRGKTLAI